MTNVRKVMPSERPLRTASTSELGPAELRQIHELMLVAFDNDFSDEDWEHTLGGVHFFLELGGKILSHAAVVPRMLEVGRSMFHTGYVEGVATHPEFRSRGWGSDVVSAATAHIRASYGLGALGTSSFSFYERLGWERWSGRTFVRRVGRRERTPDEDGYVMVLRFGPSAHVDTSADLSCDDRTGDVW